MFQNDMMRERDWCEFMDSGLLWFVNSFLHVFGWCIAVEMTDEMQPVRAFPARTRFRGFDENTITEGYRKVSNYLKKNAETLCKEADE